MRLLGKISSHFAYNSFGCMDSTRKHSVWINEGLIRLHLLSVSMNPGDMQLTLAKSTHSTARLLARCRAAALEALYAACLCGMFTRIALTDAVIIRFPLPCSLK